jgi:hypothetical protein
MVHHLFDRKMFPHKFLAALAELHPEICILCQAENTSAQVRQTEDSFAQDLRNPEGHEKARSVENANFPRTIAVGRDNGARSREGLRQHAGQAFAAGYVHNDVHDADQLG